MVDAHTHISEPGRTHWEGYETGTRAAAKRRYHHDDRNALNQLPATVDRETIELKFDAAKGKLTIDTAQLGGWFLTTSIACTNWMTSVSLALNALLPPAVTAVSIMISPRCERLAVLQRRAEAGGNESDGTGALRKRAHL